MNKQIIAIKCSHKKVNSVFLKRILQSMKKSTKYIANNISLMNRLEDVEHAFSRGS